MFENYEYAYGIYCDGFMYVYLSPIYQVVYIKYVQFFGCK